MHYKHDNFVQMAAPIGKFLLKPYDVICTCVYACMGQPHTPTPTTTHIHPPQGGECLNQLKWNETSTKPYNSILFKDLKFLEIYPPMGGCIIWWMSGWMGGWVDGWGHVKSENI